MLTHERLLEILMTTARRLYNQQRIDGDITWDVLEEERHLRRDILSAGQANRHVPRQEFFRFFRVIQHAAEIAVEDGLERDPQVQVTGAGALAYMRGVAEDLASAILPGKQMSLPFR